MVLPLPQHDPGARRCGSPRGGAGPRRLRPLRQAGRPGRLQLCPARRVDAAGAVRRSRAHRPHAGRPGLGRADRAAAGRRAPGPVHPGRRRQHVPADGRPPRRPTRSSAGSGSPSESPRVRRRTGGGGGCTTRRSRRRWSPPTTRPSPTTATRPARGPSPRSCRPAPTTRPARPTGRPGRCSRPGTKPFLTAFSDGDPVTAGGDRAFQAAGPGRTGHAAHHPVGGGHFLQEDAGPELARVVVDLVAATPR